jgi:uncharacterized protein GlcG (DUF336 family)
MRQRSNLVITGLAAALIAATSAAQAESCAALHAVGLSHASLKAAVSTVVPPLTIPVAPDAPNGGLGFPMWLTLVDDSGKVCAVVNSLTPGQKTGSDIWLGSRVISAQKANTANAFSTNVLALSTANLYSAVQPGGSLYGLQASNPVDATEAYDGPASAFGASNDPMVGKRIGGINVFGGGLAIYIDGHKAGAIGVSGDTSCTDHVVAWKVRDSFITAGKLTGVPPFGNFDKMLQDITPNPAGGTGNSASGFGHPTCLNNPTTASSGGSIVFP